MIASSLALLAPPAVAATRTISNVASVSWSAGTTTRSANSNRVDLDFTDAGILQTYVTSTGILPSGALQASCEAGGPRLQPGQTSPLSGSTLNVTQALIAGRSMVLSVTLASANRDPNVVDRITGTVQSSAGDTETVTFIESGPNTGVFLAALESAATPPAPTAGDCRLSVTAGSNVAINLNDSSSGSPLASGTIAILIDPYGTAFDSRTGTPVSDVRITLVDAATGQPAVVYGDDGSSIYPSSVIAGQTVTDSGGHIYPFSTGEYRFPLVAPGNYRLLVEPVAPYSFASTLSPAQLSGIQRPDGQPFTITDGSYGRQFNLGASASVRIDLPLDRPASPLIIAKTVNQPEARSGDLLVYQIDIRNPGPTTTGPISLTDYIPPQMRYRAKSALLNHQGTAEPGTSSARALTFSISPLAAGAHELLSYVLEVRPGAATGDAVNKAQAFADGLSSNVSDAVVRIRSDDIAERVTLIGRVLGGGCDTNPARGVPGIRVMLEDGSYALTDRDGRYHFEGLQPGMHVVQIDRGTVPEGAEAIDCANDVRSGGRATSRFFEGLGGELKRVDFRLAPASLRPAATAHPTPTHLSSFRPSTPQSDAAAAGAERDWLAGTTTGIDFLFPAMEYNPRSPVTRVVIKHLPGQQATLFINGQESAPLAFEGTRKSTSGEVAVSIWRGIPLADRSTELKVVVSNARGEIVKTLIRTVVFANVPAHVELLREQSSLLADGVHRPVLALRITDRSGRPVHQGVAGEFELPAPYFPAIEADAQQARQLAGLERARPAWHVSGDDGIAYVELEPTTASGTVSMRFNFRDGQSTREERLEAWLSPGDRPWTVVGLAEGSFGYNRINKHLQDLGPETPEDLVDGRLALYAKGKVSGRWLLTLSYDSDKHRRDAPFSGTIDPQQYYTVYADRSERRYDGASIRKLYIRLERPQFFALFGDYDTGIDEPVLARYVRSFSGGKTEYRSPQVAATAFVANSPLSHQRDEIQGNGLSGPYTLRSRSILANSERITLQTRDRFRSEVIVNEQILSRHVDYDIDYQRGTLIFRSPVLGRSSSLDPQFIIAEYDVDRHGRSVIDAGARATWRDRNQRIQVGATVIHDNDGTAKTDLIGADIKVRVTPNTEVRGETALSRKSSDASVRSTATAWLMEVEHHDGRLDVLGYAGQRDVGFGVGQTNQVESGTRKFGVDLRWHAKDYLSVTASAWHHTMLTDGAKSDAARLLAEYRREDVSARAGFTFAHDELAAGGSSTSTLLNLGASKRFDHGRAELGFDSEIPLGASDKVIDFPARHRFTARYAVTRWASLVGSYEVAKSDLIDARTARIGFDLAPWAGAKIALSGNVQDIPEYGRRSFAAFGLAQSVILSKEWSLDFSLDSNRTLGGIDPARVVNARQPAASGGFVGDGSTITEDYTAVTAGATYRSGRLSVTGRGEYRDGEMDKRKGLILGAIRQIGEGRALAGGIDWFEAKAVDGARTSVTNGSLTWANRPANRPLSWLDKFEVRRDAVSGATVGSTDVLGHPLSVVGDARSLRVINSLTINYSNFSNRIEASLFWGSRYTSARFGDDDVKGWSNMLAGDARLSIGNAMDVGVAGTVRFGVSAQSVAFSYGPQLNVRPATNTWVTLGYNFNGYRDRDFSADRFTKSGAYITLRLKFDELTFQSLGIGGRR